jgi:predicted O-methyltransferase YrrM
MRKIKQLVLRTLWSAGYELLRRDGNERIQEYDFTQFPKPKPPEVVVLPVCDIPYHSLDLGQTANPIQAIMQSPEFKSTVAFFVDNPAASRSLVSADSQALLFTLIRNLGAKCVVEIGSFRCGTAEAICRALHANGSGQLYTVDPFGAATVPGIVAWWPEALQRHVRFVPSNSATFFMKMEKRGLRPELVFVDGNHDYEFALFDIQCAARRVASGGFICVDNISQPGPFFAAVDFLKANPDWTECGTSAGRYEVSKAFDKERTSIHNTDMTVLRAPAAIPISARPTTTGEQVWSSNSVQGLTLALAPGHGPGLLHVQCVVRGFGETEQIEITGETTVSLAGDSPVLSASFAHPVTLQGKFVQIRVEPWLVWRGEPPLRLLEPPTIF